MKIKNEEIMPARLAIRALLNYEHPLTRAGVRQETTLKFMGLDRQLRQHGEDYDAAMKELVTRYGEEKVPGDPDTSFIGKDSPYRGTFLRERRALDRLDFEIEDRFQVKLSELKVRDENGDLVDIECGQIAHLGPILLDDRGEAEPKAAARPPRRHRRQRPVDG